MKCRIDFVVYHVYRRNLGSLIMEELYKKTESVLKGETKYFQTISGVRQGGPEPPNLFDLFLDYIMRS